MTNNTTTELKPNLWRHVGGGNIADSYGWDVGRFVGEVRYRDQLIMAVNEQAERKFAGRSAAHGEPSKATSFDDAWDGIDWDVWRMQPINELVRHLHSITGSSKPGEWNAAIDKAISGLELCFARSEVLDVGYIIESLQAVRRPVQVGGEPSRAEVFCDGNCTWLDHHPDCKIGSAEQVGDMEEFYRHWACCGFVPEGANMDHIFEAMKSGWEARSALQSAPERKALSDTEANKIWERMGVHLMAWIKMQEHPVSMEACSGESLRFLLAAVTT